MPENEKDERDARIGKLEQRVEVLEETLQRIARYLSGDEGACSGGGAVVRDCILAAIEDDEQWR